MKKLKRVFRIIKYALLNKEDFLLRIIEGEAKDYIKQFSDLEVSYLEDFENLIFHIESYRDIAKMLNETEVSAGIYDIEKFRAVEREYIFELVKRLPIGFEL